MAPTTGATTESVISNLNQNVYLNITRVHGALNDAKIAFSVIPNYWSTFSKSSFDLVVKAGTHFHLLRQQQSTQSNSLPPCPPSLWQDSTFPIMAFLTPRQDPRRLSFGTNLTSTFSNPPQSPYTPLSASRSSAAPGPAVNAAPHIPSPFSSTHLPISSQTPHVHTPEPSEEAEAFVSGGLKTQLRAVSLHAVTIAHKTIDRRSPKEIALNFATHLIEEISILFDLSSSLHAAPSIRPSTRRHIATLRDHLLLELRTWSLIHASWTSPERKTTDLVTDRLQLSPRHLLRVMNVDGVAKVQHVIEWLEHGASDDLKRSGGPLVNPLDDPAYRWRYTAEQFDGEPVSMDFPIRGKHVSHQHNAMGDVDEVGQEQHQSQGLLEIEKKAENRLARGIFKLVRAGMLDEAVKVCRDAGQPWRAAALGGGKKASSLASNGLTGAARKAWRKAARALATTTIESVPLHERAVAAALSGVLGPVLAVSTSYDDQLWARLSVLLDGTVEKVLDKPPTSSSSGMENDVSRLGLSDDAILETFRECKMMMPSSASNLVGGGEGGAVVAGLGMDGNEAEIASILRRVQSYIALGTNIGEAHRIELLECLAQLARSASEHGLEWGCRLAVEVGLFLKYSGMLTSSSNESMLYNFDCIIQMYVQFVVQSNTNDGDEDDPFQRNNGSGASEMDERANVCAIACTFLSEMDNMEVAVATYSKLMQIALRADLLQEAAEARRAKVEPQSIEERRVLCLEEAGNCFETGVLMELTKYTVDQVWDEYMDELREGAGGMTIGTPRRGSSGGPIRMSEGRRLTGSSPSGGMLDTQAVAVSNSAEPGRDEMVIRSIEFLTYSGYSNYEEALVRTTAATRRFFLSQKRETARRLVGTFPNDVLESMREELYAGYIEEHKCWGAYFLAVSYHNDWYVYQTKNEPTGIPDNVRKAAMAQPVHMEAKEKLHMYNAAMREYEKGCAELKVLAIRYLYDALFHSGGWMTHVGDGLDGEGEEGENAGEIVDANWAERKRELDMVRKCGIPELVSLVHHVLHRSGDYKDAADMVSLVANEEYKLHRYYRPTEMRALLSKVAESTIKMTDDTVTLDDDLKFPFEGQFFEDFGVKSTRAVPRVTFVEP